MKVSRNAPKGRSGAPQKRQKAFRGVKMSVFASEPFRGRNVAITIAYNSI